MSEIISGLSIHPKENLGRGTGSSALGDGSPQLLAQASTLESLRIPDIPLHSHKPSECGGIDALSSLPSVSTSVGSGGLASANSIASIISSSSYITSNQTPQVGVRWLPEDFAEHTTNPRRKRSRLTMSPRPRSTSRASPGGSRRRRSTSASGGPTRTARSSEKKGKKGKENAAPSLAA